MPLTQNFRVPIVSRAHGETKGSFYVNEVEPSRMSLLLKYCENYFLFRPLRISLSQPLNTNITTLVLLSHRVKLEPFCVFEL